MTQDDLLKFLSTPLGVAMALLWMHSRLKTIETRLDLLAGHVGAPIPQKKNRMKNLLLLTVAVSALVLSGCARFTSVQVKTEPDGTRTESRQKITTFFDAKSEVSKLRASTTDKTQGLTVGSVSNETSGTNATALAESVVSAAVTAAIKSAVPVP